MEKWGPAVAGAGALAFVGWLVVPSVIETRRINRLEPTTRRAYRALLRLMSNRGMRIHTGQTRRSEAQQRALVEKDKSTTLRSWHLAGRAIDAYPYDPNTGKPDMKGRRVDLFRIMHADAKAIGFKGLAFKPDGSKRYIRTKRGRRLWDAGHLQFQGQHRTVAAAIAAERKAIA